MGRLRIAFNDEIHLEFAMLDVEQLRADPGLTPPGVLFGPDPVRQARGKSHQMRPRILLDSRQRRR